MKIRFANTICCLVVSFASCASSEEEAYPSRAIEFRISSTGDRAFLSSLYHDAPGGHLYALQSGTNCLLQEIKGVPELCGDSRLGWSIAHNAEFLFVGLDTARGTPGEVLVLDARNPHSLVRRLTSPSAANDDRFGRSLAVDSRNLAIGSSGDGKGRVFCYRFETKQTVFVQEIEESSDDEHSQFGRSLAVDEKTLLIGAPGTTKGNAYLYEYRNQKWEEVDNLGTLAVSTKKPGSKLGGHAYLRRKQAVVSSWSRLHLFDVRHASFRLIQEFELLSRKGKPMRVLDACFSGNELAAIFTARGQDVFAVWTVREGDWKRSYVRDLPDPYRTDFALSMAKNWIVVAGSG